MIQVVLLGRKRLLRLRVPLHASGTQAGFGLAGFVQAGFVQAGFAQADFAAYWFPRAWWGRCALWDRRAWFAVP